MAMVLFSIGPEDSAMTRFVLKDDGYTFKKIMSGGKWIGRVCKHVDGRYMGMIGKSYIVYAQTEEGAFRAVVAQWCGFPDAAAMQARNASVAHRRRHLHAVARHAADEISRGNFKPFEQMLDHIIKKDGE